MAKRRYKIEITDYDRLQEAYPLAIKERVIRTFDYAYIAKLLDCQLPVPGVIVGDQQMDIETLIRKEA